MSLEERIGVLLLTYNEEANIERTLAKLDWAKRILVVDSGSTDQTAEIVRRHAQAELIHRPFDGFANQCNFGLSSIGTDWVLSLDADYVLSDALVAEIRSLTPASDVSGYRARFMYQIYGNDLRATLYPPRVVLYRQEGVSYREEGHGHRLTITGKVLPLSALIYHDDRKPLVCWFASQQTYAAREAAYLLEAQSAELSYADRIRRLGWPAPILVFFYALFVKGGLFDGWRGWFYALQRLQAEIMIALTILDERLRKRHRNERD